MPRPVRAPPSTELGRRTAAAVRSGAGAAGVARVPRLLAVVPAVLTGKAAVTSGATNALLARARPFPVPGTPALGDAPAMRAVPPPQGATREGVRRHLPRDAPRPM